MKKIYYAGVLAFMLSGNANAQSGHPQRFQQQLQQSLLRNKMAKRPTAQTPDRTSTPAQSLPMCRSYATQVAKAKGSTYLLSKINVYNDNELVGTKEVRERNKYGLPTSAVVTDFESGTKDELRHIYEMSDQGYWTKRTYEKKLPNGKWTKLRHEERDINDKKQVVGCRLFVPNDDSTDLVLIEEYEMDYDESKLEKFPLYVPFYNNVFFTKNNEYSRDGKSQLKREYVWSDEFHQFLESNIQRLYSSIKGVVEGNRYVKEHTDISSEGHTFMDTKEIWYADGGRIQYRFNSSGDTTNVWGDTLSWEKDTPSKGMYTINHYQNHRSDWTLKARYVTADLNDKHQVKEGIPLVVRKEVFNQDLDKWEQTNTFHISFPAPNIVCIEDDNSVRHFRTPRLDLLTVSKGTPVVYDSGNQTYLIKSYEDDNFKEFEQYNANHELTRNICFTLKNNLSTNIDSKTTYEVTERGLDNKDTPIQNLDLQFVNSKGELERHHIICNEKGFLLEHTQQTTLKNGKTFVTSKINCDYGTDEYKAVLENYTVENGQQAVKSSTTKENFKKWGTNEFNYEIITTNSKDEIVEGYRKTSDVNAMQKTYVYSTETKDFQLTEETIGVVEKLLEDGTKYYIEREKDENGNLVNKLMTVYDGISEAEYTWDAQNNEWVGQSKVAVDFGTALKPNVIRYTADDLLFPAEDLTIPLPNELSIDNVIKSRVWEEYLWDSEKKTWVLATQNNVGLKKISDHEYLYSTEELNEYNSEKEYEHFTINADNQLLNWTEDCIYNRLADDGSDEWVQTTTSTVQDYTYDDRGLLVAEVKIKKKNGVVTSNQKTVYEYIDLSSDPTGISEVESVDDLQISGRHITAAEGAQLSVYDMSGRCILRAQHQLTLPSAGLYIVKCGNRSTKVVCR